MHCKYANFSNACKIENVFENSAIFRTFCSSHNTMVRHHDLYCKFRKNEKMPLKAVCKLYIVHIIQYGLARSYLKKQQQYKVLSVSPC